MISKNHSLHVCHFGSENFNNLYITKYTLIYEAMLINRCSVPLTRFQKKGCVYWLSVVTALCHTQTQPAPGPRKQSQRRHVMFFLVHS